MVVIGGSLIPAVLIFPSGKKKWLHHLILSKHSLLLMLFHETNQQAHAVISYVPNVVSNDFVSQ